MSSPLFALSTLVFSALVVFPHSLLSGVLELNVPISGGSTVLCFVAIVAMSVGSIVLCILLFR